MKVRNQPPIRRSQPREQTRIEAGLNIANNRLENTERRRAAEFDLRRRQREQASEMEESSDDEFASDTELPDFYESDFESDDDNDDDDEDSTITITCMTTVRISRGTGWTRKKHERCSLRYLSCGISRPPPTPWMGPLMSHLTPEQIESDSGVVLLIAQANLLSLWIDQRSTRDQLSATNMWTPRRAKSICKRIRD